MATKIILILGGGMSGILAARELRRQLGNEYRIIIVDQNTMHFFYPSYLWVMIGWRRAEAIERPLSSLEKYGIEVQHATVLAILPNEQKVVTNSAILRYDYLIISLGSETESETISGLSEASRPLYSLDSAVKLNKLILSITGGTIAIVVPRLPYKFPPLPYETAMLLESFFHKRKILDVNIKVFTPEMYPLEFAGDKIGRAILQQLIRPCIEVYTNHKLNAVDYQNNQLIFENGFRAKYDLLLTIPSYRSPKIVAEANLSDETGWISVDRNTLQTCFPNVYAIGDITTILLENGHTLPKASVFALNQAEVVAYDIVHKIKKSELQKKIDGSGFFFIETGNGKAMNIHGNFFAATHPDLILNDPSFTFHWAKVVIEKYWFWRWF